MSTRIAVGFAPLLLAAAVSQNLYAQASLPPHHDIEEVIVTGQANKTLKQTALPVSVISGEALREVVQTNLGDTLKSQAGVHSASFGTGVGRPIIRGQSGNRVRVLQGGLSNLDASAVSPDHANGLSPLAAERIEIIRGPATLLYGNGAIGGVVNVIDNRIPTRAAEKPKFVVDYNHNTNNDQDTLAFLFEAASGPWQWHLDGNLYESGTVEIPGDALVDDGDEEEGEELRSGIIDNSDTEGDSFTVGNSYIGDSFVVGWSINQLNNDYGLPPGVHGDEGEGEEEEVEVRIELEQTRYELKGQWTLDGPIELLEAQVAYTDYEHQEIEIELGEHTEGEGEEEEEDHEGTEFSNEGFDARFKLQHAEIAGWSGIVGLQWQDRTFGAVGEEAYIGEADVSSLGIFAVESLTQNNWTYEIGARLEQNSTELSANCDQDETTFSASGSALRQLNAESSAWVSVSYSERAATEEELFSNVDGGQCQVLAESERVEHVATGQIELGNPDLDKESSQNIELGWRKYSGHWQAEINLYYNEISDYIYLAETGADEEVFYAQEDASFIGLEAQFTTHLMQTDSGHLDLSLMGDWVQAELDNGDSVPRLAPARIGSSIGWSAERWSTKLSWTEVLEQSETAPSESSTDGYSQVQAFANYHLLQGNSEWSIYARGNNLLDEDIRDHTSFIKDAAPAPGIGFEIGTRVIF